MKKSLELKLEQMLERFQEVERLLSEASVIADQNQFKALSKEYAQLEPIASHYDEYLQAVKEVQSLQELIDSGEKELADMAQAEKDGRNLVDLQEVTKKEAVVIQDLQLITSDLGKTVQAGEEKMLLIHNVLEKE